MVERYYIEIGRSNPKISENGDWCRYEDYAKLADLCGRMADLLGDLKIKLNALDTRIVKEMIAEAEEVLK